MQFRGNLLKHAQSNAETFWSLHILTLCDTLQSLSVPPTPNVMVKVTFIIDLDEWER